MSKYSNEFKLQVVQYCIYGNHSRNGAAKKFGIPSSSLLKEWIKRYQEHGPAGLLRNQNISYDGQFKQSVVEYMHKNHLSATEAAIKFNLANHSIVLKWERIYYEKGPQGLYIERRGRSKNMSYKPQKKKLDRQVEDNLIAENKRLKMENEYLKKLNALVQERIKQENKKK